MPDVEFARTLSVASSPETVWETVTDVGRVAGWVTVVGSIEEIEPLASYTAVLADRMGPFSLSADLAVNVTELDEYHLIVFTADGEDRQVASRIRIDARLELAPDSGTTTVDVKGRYEVTGRVAGLGSSMIRAKGDKILEQFFEALERELS
jgi:carbon monoxide dehydrogenase subunit G